MVHPDYAAILRHSFNTYLASKGLEVVEVAADGNCLFRALGEQVAGNEEAHVQVRATLIQFMKINYETFEPFNETKLPFDEYLAKMNQPGGGWGGEMEIYAASLFFGANIRIYQNSESKKMKEYIDFINSDRDPRMITLSYHNGNHYNSVRPLGYVRQEQMLLVHPFDVISEPKDVKEANEMLLVHAFDAIFEPKDAKEAEEMLLVHPFDAIFEPKDAKEAEEMNAPCCCASILLQCKRSITRKRQAEDGGKETKDSSK